MRWLTLTALLLGACSSGTDAERASHESEGTLLAEPVPLDMAEAIFAGGCFWCMEAPFEAIDGVLGVVSGYTGGHVDAPTYEAVGRGGTGHVEAVRVIYDPSRVDYERLLDVYWRNVDPTQDDGQFCDRGETYRTAIFVVDDEQRRLAEASRDRIRARLGRPVVTRILDVAPFWVAESYHQDYYRTNPARYRMYRSGCGRDRRLRELWGEPASH